ncbi:MAG: dipeptidase PepE [Bacteroidota bacterium]
MRLLLLSNSTMKGTPYLEWPQTFLREFLKDIDEVLFIPYAGVTISYDDYTSSVQAALKPTNTTVTGIHNVVDKQQAISAATCIAVGGGNTFELLKCLEDYNLIPAIREAVKKGVPYIGWSAGSNVASPTIMTTNDMPIVQPKSFEALNLVDFQLNPHYTAKTISGHGGESRDMRIKEFLTINQGMTVIGLPEGKLLELDTDQWYLKGIESESTLLFRSNSDPQKLNEGPIELG